MATMLKISRSNTKLGAFIPSVNLQPSQSCRKDAPCSKLCYGKHGRFIFPNVQATLNNNIELWLENPELFEVQVIAAAFPAKFFRWHSSGDIPSPEYLDMMVRVAKKCKDTQFLAFTKQYEFVNDYLGKHRLPSNLHIILSAWGSWIPENPYNLPMAYVRLKSGEGEIPEEAIQCSGYCGTCVQQDKHCWNLSKGESVVFNQH